MAAIDAGLWCVVAAAGRGTRVGGDIPKQYLPIAGKPLLLHTLGGSLRIRALRVDGGPRCEAMLIGRNKRLSRANQYLPP